MSKHSDNPHHHHHCCDIDHSAETGGYEDPPRLKIFWFLLVIALTAGAIKGYFALKSWYFAHTGIDISFFK